MEAGTVGMDAEAERGRRRVGGRLLRIGLLALMAAVVALWALVLRPVWLGGPAEYVIVSGESMEPTLRTGDLALALEQSSYGVGDIVVFHVPEGEPGAGTQVIHRIVGGSGATGFVLRGDNKDGIDPWRPKAEDVVGKMRLTVPRVGWGMFFLRTPLGLGLIAGLMTLLVFLAIPGGPQQPLHGHPSRSASGESGHRNPRDSPHSPAIGGFE
jgi:signal peptidase